MSAYILKRTDTWPSCLAARCDTHIPSPSPCSSLGSSPDFPFPVMNTLGAAGEGSNDWVVGTQGGDLD